MARFIHKVCCFFTIAEYLFHAISLVRAAESCLPIEAQSWSWQSLCHSDRPGGMRFAVPVERLGCGTASKAFHCQVRKERIVSQKERSQSSQLSPSFKYTDSQDSMQRRSSGQRKHLAFVLFPGPSADNFHQSFIILTQACERMGNNPTSFASLSCQSTPASFIAES